VTIVLPIKDRAAFTLRWLAYASANAFPFKVVIADGGADESVADILSSHPVFPGLDYEYVRFPHDATYAHYYAKVHRTLEHVRTPLAALADDDDFLVRDGVQQSVDFLQQHPDYASCGGQCAVFWVRSGRPAETLYGRRVEWKCSLDAQSVTADTGRERIRTQSLRATYPIYYHVHRTEQLRERFRLVREANLKDLFLVEYLLWFLTAIDGKTKQLDTLFMARQGNSPGSSGVAHLERFGDWLGRMLVPSWSADFAAFVEIASAALAARDGLGAKDARRAVIDSYRLLTAPALIEDLFGEPTTSLPRTIVRALRQLLQCSQQHALRRAARAAYRRVAWIAAADTEYGTRLRARRVADRAFAPVRDFLTHLPAAAHGAD
jgi:glycosyltransferase domain-containing protein